MKKSKKILIAFGTVILTGLVIFFVPESKKEIKTQHFTFLFSRGIDTVTILKLANALENNYSRISNDLDTKPSANIETNIYAQRWRYERLPETGVLPAT